MTGSTYQIDLNGSYYLPIPQQSSLSREKYVFVYPNVKIKGVVICDESQYNKITSQIKAVIGGNPQLAATFTSIISSGFKAEMQHQENIAFINIEPIKDFGIINGFSENSKLTLKTFDDPLLKGYAELIAE